MIRTTNNNLILFPLHYVSWELHPIFNNLFLENDKRVLYKVLERSVNINEFNKLAKSAQ